MKQVVVFVLSVKMKFLYLLKAAYNGIFGRQPLSTSHYEVILEPELLKNC